MTPKTTLRWLILAAGLFGLIVCLQRFGRKPEPTPAKILPNLRASAVVRVQVRPANQLEIRAERTNQLWQLTAPVIYPAESVSIQDFLTALERLTPATCINPGDLKDNPKAAEDFGFANPQAVINLEQNDYRAQLQIGARTAPGDQVFLQVGSGLDGIYVVSADFLKLLPVTADSWRDKTLINLSTLAFDHIYVTNGANILAFQRDGSIPRWRMVSPMPARADNSRIEEALQTLQAIRATGFLPDGPKADADSLGLQHPELELAFGQGTNLTAVLQFGRTNDSHQVYARRAGQNTVLLVPNDPLAAWRVSSDKFRNPHLVELSEPVGAIQVHADDSFSLERTASNSWWVLPQNFPADTALVQDLVSGLSQLQVIEFVKAVVTDPDLPDFGLAPPAPRQYILKASVPETAVASNAQVIAELDFGTNREDKVFARRADENSVYAVKLAEFQRLPAASWQLRERQIWNLSTNGIARLSVRREGRVREFIRNGPQSWSLAPGSQGQLNDLAIEQIAAWLAHLAADSWVARGQQCRAQYGFTDSGLQISLESKTGARLTVDFGGPATTDVPYAGITLDGDFWILNFPSWLYPYINNYL